MTSSGTRRHDPKWYWKQKTYGQIRYGHDEFIANHQIDRQRDRQTDRQTDRLTECFTIANIRCFTIEDIPLLTSLQTPHLLVIGKLF